jgi:hypothetical protein
MRKIIPVLVALWLITSSCSQQTTGTSKAVKPRYHHSWYKDHVYKKKWRVGRIKFEPQKQGVRQVKMKG